MVAQCHPGHTGQPQALKGQASVEGCHPLPEANLERPARPLLLEEAPPARATEPTCQAKRPREEPRADVAATGKGQQELWDNKPAVD